MYPDHRRRRIDNPESEKHAGFHRHKRVGLHPPINASFKLGVHFIDWSRADGAPHREFFHPLTNPPACGGYSPAYHFRKFGPHWLGASYGENVMPNAAVIAAGKGPRVCNTGDYYWDINYAYHIDAGLLADFMRDFAVARGVEHIRDDVVDVMLDENGCDRGAPARRSAGVTGRVRHRLHRFRSLIWSRMGAEPFMSAGDRLMNDRAIPLQLPHPVPTPSNPAHAPMALGAGWAWRVPLYSRVGTGYVYSSAFRSDDEARDEFIAHLRATGDLPADAPEPETRVIKMRVGYTRQPWIKNCVAIGLSSGFVEPLEATAIYTIDAAAHRLVMNFPDRHCNPALAKAYNERTTASWKRSSIFSSYSTELPIAKNPIGRPSAGNQAFGLAARTSWNYGDAVFPIWTILTTITCSISRITFISSTQGIFR